MAKIDLFHPAAADCSAYTETIEARIWAAGGVEEQSFYIGGGCNFRANGTLWLEIIYSVEGAQIFYTRNFLQHEVFRSGDTSSSENRLDEIVKNGEGQFGFGDMLPDTSISFTATKSTYEDNNEETQEYTYCKLSISADTGAVFGRTGPGMRSVDIKIDSINLEAGLSFMRELVREIDAVQQGKHPDPGSFPIGSSEWPFVHQLNQKAYDKISEDYEEAYFDNPVLAEAFDDWLGSLPPGGKILDAGCGIGQPVIGHLLEKGFEVTGSDFSSEMLRKAAARFPRANFAQKATTAIDFQSEFDGICSFNSMLYLDPIDLLNGVLRLYHALRPGGLLFLYGFDSGPEWRGEPYGYRVGQWMWSWHYGIEEAAKLLEEHGYFQVLSRGKVQFDKDEQLRIDEELAKQKIEEAEYYQRQESKPASFPFALPFFKMPIERTPYSYRIIARRNESKG